MQKKIVVVTGGASGIGEGIVRAFCEAKNYKVILCYKNSYDQAQNIKKQYPDQIDLFKLDVTIEESVKTLFDHVKTAYDRVDCLVNNAGGNISFNNTKDYLLDDWDKTFDLNCKSVFLMSKHAIPLLRKNGSIVNISSISSKSGGAPGGMSYAASKAAVDCMTKSLAKELAHKNINVNSISPGIVYTNQHKLFSSREYYDSLIERVPLKRDGKVQDIANLALFLATESGGYITGQILGVNGGMLMR